MTLRHALTVLFGLSACATPYQPTGARGGFSDRALGSSRYEVTISVNLYTSADRKLEYLHRRADELCRADGLPRYAIEKTVSPEPRQLVGVVQCLP